jgi:hypothetical protein
MSDVALGGGTFAGVQRRRRQAFAGLTASAIRLVGLLGISLFFLLSPMLLYKWGFSYEGVGGSAFEKVHPGTWLVLLALGLRAMASGRPLSLLDEFVRPPALALYIFAWAVLLGFTIFIKKGPFTPLIDTFLQPAMVFVLATAMSEAEKKRTALLIHLLLNINALLGLFEYLTGYRLTPYVAGTLLIESDWRSTALLGHPLANAMMTGSYILVMGIGGGRDLPKLLRPVIIGLQFLGMIAFGGRSALVLTLLLLCCVGLWNFARFLRGERTDLLQAGLIMLAMPVVVTLMVGAINGGFFDQMIERFVNDNGSAKARVIMLKLFNYVSWEDLVFGPDQALITSLQHTEGIEYGIESFWVAFVLTNGLAMSFIFFPALVAFSFLLVTRTTASTGVLLVYFYLLASTSVSMSAKTPAFGMFIILILTMLRPLRLARLDGRRA